MNAQEQKIFFAQQLNTLLKKRGYTQADLARALNLKTSTVSSWCTGERLPRTDKVDAIAKFFCVPVSSLLVDLRSSLYALDYSITDFDGGVVIMDTDTGITVEFSLEEWEDIDATGNTAAVFEAFQKKEKDLAGSSEVAKARRYVIDAVNQMSDSEIIALRKIVEQVLSLRG